MTPHKKAPSKKTRSKSRPVPFPNIQSKLSPKKKKVQLETASREKEEREGREESSSENEITTVLKFTVKKDWQGTQNYFPKIKEFKNYVPNIFDDSEKDIWHKLIAKRKGEIEKELDNIFGNAQSIEKVNYSGRLRSKFPCPVENCDFRTVDMAKHLKHKHHWESKVVKLQINYFNVMFDSVNEGQNIRLA